MEQIISRLRVHNAYIHVLLAAIIPMASDRVSERIMRYNAGLGALARSLDTPGSRVMLVDQFQGFDPERDTYDGLHPNESGARKMAAKWIESLELLTQNPEQ